MKFERVSPESVGIRSEDIREFLKEEFHSGIQLHSFMLIRHGKVAAEGWYKPYSPDARHAIYSFSKTFTQIAIGFAEQEGILSLDEKLVDLFPEELPDTVSENLALADIESLLTMSCGHETELTTEDIEKRGGNWVKAFFEQEFKYPPHTMFQYNTTGTDLLCLILLKKTGQTLTKFLTPRLFEPLEIRDVYCSTMGDRVVSPDAPYSQVEAGGWGYHMRTEDLAKFIWFSAESGRERDCSGKSGLTARLSNRSRRTMRYMHRRLITGNWDTAISAGAIPTTDPGGRTDYTDSSAM